MTKDKYLTGEVKDFFAWMSEHLDRETLAHAWRNRKSGMPWTCRSLFGAYVQYTWPHDAIARLGVEAGSKLTSNASADHTAVRSSGGACESLSMASRFRYRIAAASNETVGAAKARLEFSDEIINRTLSLLVTAEEYRENPFGLHNSATETQDPNGRWGMGNAYRRAQNEVGNAPDTSRLVAILEDVGVPERVQKEPHLVWRLAAEVEVENRCVNMRPLLGRHLAREQEA